MSDFWSWYVIILVAINILGCGGLLYFTRNLDAEVDHDGTTGHEYDGIREYNNPLPRWWLWLFYITIVYSIGYLVVYPGMGNYAGTFGWTSANQHEAEVVAHNDQFGPLFTKFAKVEVPELAKDKQAVTMGQRIFANTCFACHGSDARGGPGYPNLTDNDWNSGSTPDAIKNTITNGRTGTMPPHAAMLPGDDLKNMVAYVLSLSGRTASAGDADAGKEKFAVCAACHGADGKGAEGMELIGAPDLTDNLWLYGGSEGVITKTINEGRTGVMPAHRDILTPEQIHLVTGYIYSLSND